MSSDEVNVDQNFSFKIDGYENVLTGLGISGIDSKKSTRHVAERRLTDVELGELWRYNGLGKRIIQLPLQDAFREGFKISGDDDGEIFEYLKKKKLWKKYKECARWADVYGGCIIVLGLKDGGEFEEPVDESKILEVSFAHVYDRTQVNIQELDKDVKSENFGEPEFYVVNPLNGGEPFKVHYTRVIRIDGQELPDREKQRNNYWDDSVYQAIFREIEHCITSHGSVSRALDELIIYIMKMKGLAQQIAQGNEAKVVTRLNQVDLTRSMLSMIGIDESEEFSRDSISLTGVKDAAMILCEAISLVTGIPISLLTGQPPKGLSNNDESGMTFYYDKVSNKQEEQLTDPLQLLIKYVMLSDEGPTNGKELDDWVIEWNPIERQSETEIVENRYKQAQTDEIYEKMGSLYNVEIRESRFGGVEQSLDTTIDPSNNPPSAEELANAAKEAGEE